MQRNNSKPNMEIQGEGNGEDTRGSRCFAAVTGIELGDWNLISMAERKTGTPERTALALNLSLLPI